MAANTSSKKTAAKKTDEETPETESHQALAPEQEKGDQLPAEMGDLDTMGGTGFEEADQDSYAIPFLNILQSNSPQVKRSDGNYIKGAEEGMVFNTVSNELFDTVDSALYVVPVHYRRAFTKWTPRDDGGGFHGEVSVADFNARTDLTRDGGKFYDAEGHEYIDTRYHYVLLVREDGSFEPALITMTSTQIKKSRNIMTRLQSTRMRQVPGYNGNKPGETAPMFMTMLKLATVPEQNDSGSWYGWKPDFGESRLLDIRDEQDRELFQEAKSFRQQLLSGNVQETQPDQSQVAGEDEARDY